MNGDSASRQGCTQAGEPDEDLTSHHLSLFLSFCVILTALKLYPWTLVRAATPPYDPLNRPPLHTKEKPALVPDLVTAV
ncbi:Hypothetical predicted protein [Marmota monax]|uniref:Uncharacterized protein n=1 Tax=Marmota monax TaxID=9995 RepID=A0A5E4BW64_MARMO|nr:Hypothetical predicted protein [Marmota monax]